jgi:hypothetical protein
MARYCADYGQHGIFFQVTKGQAGGSGPIGQYTGYALGEIRGEEARTSSAAFNCDIRFVGLWDAQVKINEELCTKRLTRLIREVRPDVIITHGPEGETGHSDHQAVSIAATNAYDYAADANMYPEQLTNGLGPWQTPKLYRIVEGKDTDPVTLIIDGNEYSNALGQKYYEYSDNIICSSHLTQSSLCPETVKNHANLSLINQSVPVPDDENDIFDGVARCIRRPVCIRDWLICGAFTEHSGDLNYDYLAEEGGETAIVPIEGMITGGNKWTQIAQDRDFVDFRKIFDPNNYEAVAYASTIFYSQSNRIKKISISSHEGVKVWLNGTLVHENPDDREYDYEDMFDITLKPGNNHLLIKVKAGERYPDPDDGLIVKPWGFFAK